MKKRFLKSFIGLGLYFFVFNTLLYAWDFQIGYQSLMPKIGAREQEYKSDSGDDLTFKPRIEETIIGNSVQIGVKFDDYLIHYEQSEFNYQSTIPADNAAVTQDTPVDGKIKEQRLSFNYNLERDLAGVYVGLGISSAKEELSSTDKAWLFSGNSPLFKFGIDLILGNFRVRTERIMLYIGKHYLKVDSMGLYMTF